MNKKQKCVTNAELIKKKKQDIAKNVMYAFKDLIIIVGG